MGLPVLDLPLQLTADHRVSIGQVEALLTLTGHEAIAYAEAHGVTLSKHADPTEPARDGLTVDEAREVAREDASLIYVITAG